MAAPAAMQTSSTGLQLIEFFEGLRTKAYKCPAGVWTIGVGHTSGVKQGDICTKEQAREWLRSDVAHAERCVNDAVRGARLNQSQFDALVSFVFNLGCGAFLRSTMLKLLNAGKVSDVGPQFNRWTRAGNRVLPGLVKRRAAERSLFETGAWK